MTSRRKDARMRGSVPAVDRRTALRALGLLGGLALVPGCATGFADTQLRMATGPTEGGDFAVGTKLAQIWHRELGLSTVPRVLATAGSTATKLLIAAVPARGAGAAPVDTRCAHTWTSTGFPSRAPAHDREEVVASIGRSAAAAHPARRVSCHHRGWTPGCPGRTDLDR